MSLYDLTGNKVSFTYGRLVQISSGSYYDGYGNPLDLSGPGTVLTTGSTYPITSSWAITASYCLNSPNAIITDSVSGSFYSSSIWEFTHSLNTTPILVQTYDLDFNQIIPQNILLLNLNVVKISFPISASGYVIASRSGVQIISSSVGTNLTTGSSYPITSSWANNVISASYSLTSSYSKNSTSASYSLTASYSNTSSVALSASYSLSASFYNGSVISSSYALSSSYAPIDTYITSSWSINSLTASYLVPTNNYIVSSLTSSNLLITGTLYASSFSSSTIYITSSEFIVTDNIITLNALNPYKRYAGLELHDSGSNNFSSILWDSQNNYLFVSSSETVGSRQIILGPDNEVNLISNYIPLISGSNTITSSIIYQNTGNIGIGTTSPSAKVDVVGDVQANAFYGKSFNLTTTSGQSAIFDTFTSTGTGEVYEVTIKGNPNAGESSNYQDVIYGKIIVGTGKTGSIAAIDSIATTFVNYVQESPDPRLLYSSGATSLTASVYFNSASVDVTQKGVGQSTPIRVVIGSYAVGYVGNNTTVRIKQIL